MAQLTLLISLLVFTQVFAQDCGRGSFFNARVVSGQTARPNSWPWQVSFRRVGSTFHFCGGSLINDQWVVTAAHCVQGQSASGLQIRLGEHNFNSNEGPEQDSRIERIIVHPRYANSNNDIALVKLSQRISLKPEIKPVCLPQHGVSVDENSGQDCYITGWGRTGANRPGATVLQQARLPVISESKCRQHMGYGVTRQMICAGFGGSSTVSGCMGDSGGPFVCRDKSSNRWILHGAVSWGTRTCSAGQNEFTVFARVSEFVNWIKQYVGNVQPPPQTPTPQTPPPPGPQTPPPPGPQTPPPPGGSSVRCNFDQGNLCSFTNAGNDQFDWTIRRGSTPSGGTGPDRDVSGNGQYVYIETSYPRKPGDKAYLVSSQINGTQCLKFFYHMKGSHIGSLDVYKKKCNRMVELFKKSGSQGNSWNKAEVQISRGNRYSVLFSGTRGSDFQGDIALDEISITPGQCSGSLGTPPPPTPAPPSGSCGQKGRGLSDFPRVVGGQEAQPGEWPWQVSLMQGSFSFCGGTLVSNQYIITAAHCVKSSDWNRVTIRLGEHDMRVDEGHEQDIKIANNGITVHPRYSSRTTDYDIAVIRLSRSVQFTARIKPACINRGMDFTGQRCYISGWGTLRSGGATPKVLQEAQVPIVTVVECKKSYGSRITDRMVCAGYPQGGIDACQGDSGGPLVCKHSDGSWHLTGVTSWGRGCASAGYYGVYAQVSNLYPWVKKVTGL